MDPAGYRLSQSGRRRFQQAASLDARRASQERDRMALPTGSEREFDLVLFGASGFTGRLVAGVLRDLPASRGPLRWALAGRDAARLAAVRAELGLPAETQCLTADAADREALGALAARCRVVLTTVGPYERFGTALVESCAAAGTDYVDLCGEPLWMHRMIARLTPRAADTGARIVFSCGFDSVPFDLGVVFLQHEMQQRLGAPALEVRTLVTALEGGLSGGTVASALATVEATRRDRSLARLMADPFALTPGFDGPAQPEDPRARFDDWTQAWTSPFLMSPINTKNVHRTHALRGHPWGREFRYSERQWCGRGRAGQLRALARARQSSLTEAVLTLAPARALLRRTVLPRPGQGPGEAARAAGHYTLQLLGRTARGQQLTVQVRGEGDPGYGSTSRMVTEAALCLLRDVRPAATPGGVWTPGAAMGLALQRRLSAHAGLHFEVLAG
jgi:short subunit dehydrogenase-like uncharacterized protein